MQTVWLMTWVDDEMQENVDADDFLWNGTVWDSLEAAKRAIVDNILTEAGHEDPKDREAVIQIEEHASRWGKGNEFPMTVIRHPWSDTTYMIRMIKVKTMEDLDAEVSGN